MPREPLVSSTRVRLRVPLPRPKGKRGLKHVKLPVPDLMAIEGLFLGAPFATPTSAFAGWRLYVSVAEAALVEGVSLVSVDRENTTIGRPVRQGQIVILTPREPVDVVVGVEWAGKGKPRRLPHGVEITIAGHH